MSKHTNPALRLLARADEIIGFAVEEIRELEQENIALKAHVEKLLAFVASVGCDSDADYGNAMDLLDQTPAQSLAEHEAKVIKAALNRFADEYAPHGLNRNYTAFDVAAHARAQAEYYANQLIKKVK